MMNTVKTQMKFRKALKKLPKMDARQIKKYMKEHLYTFIYEPSMYSKSSFECFVENERGLIRFLSVKSSPEHREKIYVYSTEDTGYGNNQPIELIRECNLYW